MYVLALDISNGRSYCVLYHNQTCLFSDWILHNQTGFSKLLSVIRGCERVPEIVFEATGVYSRVMESFCHHQQLPYCLLNPLEARKQTDSLRVNKTDKSDAHKLAQSHYIHQRAKTQRSPSNYQQLRELSRWYQAIDHQMKFTRNQLHLYLVQSFPEHETYFSTLFSEYALKIIAQFPHPQRVQSLSRTQLKNILRKQTGKHASDARALKKAEELIQLAHHSYPAVMADSVESQLVTHWANVLLELVQLKKEVQSRLIEQAQELKEFNVYVSYPGIGELSAALLIAELGDLTRFKTAKQLNAYVGIDIHRYQSGNSGTYDRISKRGNTAARKLLYITITNMIRTQRSAPNHLVNYYYRAKEKPHAKKHKVVMIGCIDRFLKSIHYLTHHGKLYDYKLSPQ